MFSRTTIASSITMPTDSVSASIVIELSVKPMYQISPKVAMIDVGIAIAEIMVDRSFGMAVLDLRDIGDAEWMTRFLSNDDVVELGHGLHAAARAQRERLRALIDTAAWNLDVLRLQRARDVGDGKVVRAQPVGIEPDIDLTLAAAEDQ